MKQIVREPLVQFLILGTLLFFVVKYAQGLADSEAHEITLQNEQVTLMILNYKTQTGSFPTRQQLDVVIENYIQEEISYREAKKMGLDKDDEIIRRRLSQKYDFTQTDLTTIPAPSLAQLKEFYTNNPSLFRDSATVSFTHVYFSSDKSTPAASKTRAVKVLEEIKRTDVKRASEKGDRFPLLFDYTDQTRLDIKQNFGDKEFVTELFYVPLRVWAGPFESGYGWHLVYANDRQQARQLPFEEVREEVAAAWTDNERVRTNKAFYDRLRSKYTINRLYLHQP